MAKTTNGVPGTVARSRLTGKYGPLEEYVWTKIEVLQAEYLAGVSSAGASLARLRRAVSGEPGADPSIWDETIGGLPSQFLGGDLTVSTEERAVHAALTLYATHQQSKQEKMHRRGISFGAASGKLGYAVSGTPGARSPAVLRRFQALSTASSFGESLVHARGLIGQFRSEGIALDYGRMAVDLARLQDPRSADQVRLEWGRAYYFKATDPDVPGPSEKSVTASMTSNGDNA